MILTRLFLKRLQLFQTQIPGELLGVNSEGYSELE